MVLVCHVTLKSHVTIGFVGVFTGVFMGGSSSK